MLPAKDKYLPWQSLLDFLEKRGALFSISGLKGSSPAYVLSQVAPKFSAPILFLTLDEARAERISREIAFFANPTQKILFYPSWDAKLFEKISPSPEVLGQRWEVRHHLSTAAAPSWIISSLPAALQKVPPREVTRRFAILIFPSQEFQRDDFAAQLEGMGYTRVHVVTQKGEFAVRGYLMDIFSPANTHPLRIEFFGDRIDSVQTFDPDSQRSLLDLEKAVILPVKEALFFPEFQEQAVQKLGQAMGEEGTPQESAQEIQEKIRQGISFPGVDFYLSLFYPVLESFLDYLPPDTLLFLDDPPELEERLTQTWAETQEGW